MDFVAKAKESVTKRESSARNRAFTAKKRVVHRPGEKRARIAAKKRLRARS